MCVYVDSLPRDLFDSVDHVSIFHFTGARLLWTVHLLVLSETSAVRCLETENAFTTCEDVLEGHLERGEV
jgi:hypothetical protein